MKWLVLILIVVGVYYVSEHWETFAPQWETLVSRVSPAIPKPAPDAKPTAPTNFLSGLTGESWSVQNQAGLIVDLPVHLQFMSVPQPAQASNVRIECFKGQSSRSLVVLAHGSNTTMAGGLNFTGTEKHLAIMAEKMQMEVISHNTATTLINGMRVRRSDYVSRSSTPRIRDRSLLFERANQAWLLEFLTPENDPAAEQDFQKIAYSARPL